MKFFAYVMLLTGASAKLFKKNQSAVPAGKVFMSENHDTKDFTQIYGAGATGSTPAMGECNKLTGPGKHLGMKVCGSTIKVTAFLKNSCDAYKSVTIGHCDTSLPNDACHEIDADSSETAGFQHFQSYKIEYCS